MIPVEVQQGLPGFEGHPAGAVPHGDAEIVPLLDIVILIEALDAAGIRVWQEGKKVVPGHDLVHFLPETGHGIVHRQPVGVEFREFRPHGDGGREQHENGLSPHKVPVCGSGLRQGGLPLLQTLRVDALHRCIQHGEEFPIGHRVSAFSALRDPLQGTVLVPAPGKICPEIDGVQRKIRDIAGSACILCSLLQAGAGLAGDSHGRFRLYAQQGPEGIGSQIDGISFHKGRSRVEIPVQGDPQLPVEFRTVCGRGCLGARLCLLRPAAAGTERKQQNCRQEKTDQGTDLLMFHVRPPLVQDTVIVRK